MRPGGRPAGNVAPVTAADSLVTFTEARSRQPAGSGPGLNAPDGLHVLGVRGGRFVGLVHRVRSITEGARKEVRQWQPARADSGSRYADVSDERAGAAPGMVYRYDLHALSRVASVEVGQQAGRIVFREMETTTQ